MDNLGTRMNSKITNIENNAELKLRDQFLAGDDHAYSLIYNKYVKDLYAFGLSLNAPREFVEDAIHDIFVDLYTKKENLKHVNNLKFYFLAAFRNRLFFLIKNSNKIFDYGIDAISDENECDQESKWIEREIEDESKDLVKNMLSNLNIHQREVIYHRYVEGLSCNEISQIMGINYQSVKNLIHRAIKKIKSLSTIGFNLILLFFWIFC